MKGLRQRLRAEEGFGLVELMISLVVLNVGILAIVAGFNAGTLSLLRATETSTASVLGDKQLELYRAITYARHLAQHDGGRRDLHRRCRLPRDAGDGAVHVAGRRLVRSDANRDCRPEPRRSSVPHRHVHHHPDAGEWPAAQARHRGRPRTTPLKTLFRTTSNFDQATG